MSKFLRFYEFLFKRQNKYEQAQNLYIIGNELNNQIKSATYNNGDFDINNKNIYR